LETPASRLRPTLIPDQVCIYYMFSVLDSVVLLYQTSFVFIICSLFLTPPFSYTRPGLYLLYVLCSWPRPTFIPDQVCIYYIFSVLDSVLLLYQTRLKFIICSLFLTPSYSYTRPGLYLLYVLCSWLRPTLIPDQVCMYYMFSVLDSVLLLYQTRFVFIICSPFLTPSYSYTSPAGLFIIMNSLSLTPSYSLSYQTWVIYSHFTIILLCPTLISDQVQIFSFLDSVLL